MRIQTLLLSTLLAGAATVHAQTNSLPASGNVGIGTLTPNEKLEIAGDGRLFIGDGGGTTRKGLLIDAVEDGTYVRLHAYNYGALQSLNLVLNPSGGGNVGIGTVTPQAKLDVQGDIKSESLTMEAAAPTLSLRPSNGGFGRWSAIDLFGTFGYAGNGDTGARRFAQIKVGSDAGGAWETAYFSIWGNRGDTGNSSEVFRINTDTGNVGIGTKTPSAKLTVTGGNDDARIKLYSNGGSVAVIDAVANTNDATGRWLSINPTGGNVAIGTVNPSHKLTVNGTIRAKEVIVDTGWSDYVFAPDYRLAPLNEVEQQIKNNKHLPGIPSAREVAEKGISVGDMQARLLAKIEELTLHIIAQEKQLQAQQDEIRKINARLVGN